MSWLFQPLLPASQLLGKIPLAVSCETQVSVSATLSNATPPQVTITTEVTVTPNLFAKRKLAVAIETAVTVTTALEGGEYAIPELKPPPFDYTDDLLNDIGQVPASTRKVAPLLLEYNVEGWREKGSDFGINTNPLNEDVLNSAGYVPILPNLVGSLGMKWQIASYHLPAMNMKWSVKPELTTVEHDLNQRWKSGYPEAAPVPAGFNQKWSVEVTSITEVISGFNFKNYTTGTDYWLDFIDRVNEERAVPFLPPLKGYRNKRYPDACRFAWQISHNMAVNNKFDVEDPSYPVGWRTISEQIQRVPEGFRTLSYLWVAYPMSVFPVNGTALATSLLYQITGGYEHLMQDLALPTTEQFIWVDIDPWHTSTYLESEYGYPAGTKFAFVTCVVGALWLPGGDGTVDSTFNLRYQTLVAPTVSLTTSWEVAAYTRVHTQNETTYSIALAQQHEAQAGCMVARQHEAPIHYGLLASHEAAYQAMISLAAQNESPYIIDQYAWARQQHEAGFSSNLIVVGHLAEYTKLDRVQLQTESDYELEQYLYVRQQHDAGYSGSFLSIQHEAWYYPLGRISSQHQSNYTAVSAVAVQQEAVYDLTALNRILLEHRSIFSLLPSLLVSVPPGGPAPAQRVVYFGRDMEVTQAVVEVAEGDVAWTFEANLANVSDYQTIQRGEPITVVIEGDSYSMFVTSKELRRSGPANADMTIRGSSPILLKAPPFAPLFTEEYTLALNAEAIVEDALGEAVDWQTVDWIIPAYRVAITEGSPIDLATQVAGAVGAVLESLQDGSLRVRPYFPISVPDFDTAVPDFVFTDVEHGLSYYEGYEPVTGYNRFRIRDADSTYADSLEYIEDAVDPLSGGVIRAYPSPWRATTVLEHTWDSRVSITPLGLETRTIEKELVEFIAGEGSTQQPILAILDVEWESLPITGLTFEPHTSQIKTTNLTDFGLAKITYTVQSYNYRVSQPVGTDVQYILRDV